MTNLYFADRTILELGDDTDRSSDAGSTSSRTKKRKKAVKKKNPIEIDSGEDEKPKKKKNKTNEKAKAKKGKKKGWLPLLVCGPTYRYRVPLLVYMLLFYIFCFSC